MITPTNGTKPRLMVAALTLLLLPGISSAQTVLDTAGTYDGTQASVDSGSISLQNDFSITFWFKTTETSDRDFWQLQGQGPDNGVLSLRLDEMTAAPNAGDWFPETDSTGASYGWSRFREPDYSSSAIFNAADDVWHQLTYTFDFNSGSGNGTATLYIDGGSLATKGPDSFGDNTGVFSIFAGGKVPFIGEFSDTAIYTTALSSTEVLDLYNAGAGTVVIPEPSTAALLAGAGLLLAAARRRRR